MSHILVVEDDVNLSYALVDTLEIEGYQVSAVDTVAKAQTIVNENSDSITLILLDVMLPDGNGYQFCQWLKSQNYQAFVLMLTARNLDQDIVDGFVSGADDYVTKPYKSQELLLRIKALLRRGRQPMSDLSEVSLNEYKVNWSSRQVVHQGNVIHLTKTAFDLLQFLHGHANTVVSREQILNKVWGENVFVDNRTVDNFVYQLKKSMQLVEDMPCYIKSVRGVGYSLIVP